LSEANKNLLSDPSSRHALALGVAIDATILGESPQAIDVLRTLTQKIETTDPVEDPMWSLTNRTIQKLISDYEMQPQQAQALAQIGLQRIQSSIKGAKLSSDDLSMAADFAARSIAWRSDINLMKRHEDLLSLASTERKTPGGSMKWAGHVNEAHVLGTAGYQRSTPLLAVQIFRNQLQPEFKAPAPAPSPVPKLAPKTKAQPPAQPEPQLRATQKPAEQPDAMKRLMGGIQDVKSAMSGGRKRPGFWSLDKMDTPENTPAAPTLAPKSSKS
jgi:hypothetical protein